MRHQSVNQKDFGVQKKHVIGEREHESIELNE